MRSELPPAIVVTPDGEEVQQAVYGTTGQQEFYPLGIDGNWMVVNGVRMSEASARLFVFYGGSSDVSAS